MDQEQRENINELILVDNEYFVYPILEKCWNKFTKYYLENKTNLHLTSYVQCEIPKNNIIMIYVKFKRSELSGFIGITCLEKSLEINNENIKIFDDDDMNKYITVVDKIFLFSKVYKISDICKFITNKDFKSSKSFLVRYCKGDSHFNKINQKLLGCDIIKSMIDFKEIAQPEVKTKIEKKIEGHIPILMIPCKKFNINKWKIEFIKHYGVCKDCEITNNNNCEFSKFMNNKLNFKVLKNIKNINTIIDYYLNSCEYVFIEKEDIKILKITCEESGYNNCIIIVF
jgi:hypothetical protein